MNDTAVPAETETGEYVISETDSEEPVSMPEGLVHQVYKKPVIYVYSDSALMPEEKQLISLAVSDTGKVFPMFDCLNLADEEKTDVNQQKADAFLIGSFNECGQADSTVIFRKLREASASLPNTAAVVLMTGRDIYSSRLGIKYAFAVASYKKHIVIHSVFRYRNLSSEEKLRCIRRTLRHELGHCFGMANDPNRENTKDVFGPHCTTKGCSMRQTETLDKLLRLSEEEEELGVLFCGACLQDLRKYYNSVYLGDDRLRVHP